MIFPPSTTLVAPASPLLPQFDWRLLFKLSKTYASIDSYISKVTRLLNAASRKFSTLTEGLSLDF